LVHRGSFKKALNFVGSDGVNFKTYVKQDPTRQSTKGM